MGHLLDAVIFNFLILLLLNIGISQTDIPPTTIPTPCKCSPGKTTVEQLTTPKETRTYKVTNTGTCNGPCKTIKTYKWTISSEPAIADIIGDNSLDVVDVKINGSGMFTLMVDVTITCSSQTSTHLRFNIFHKDLITRFRCCIYV